ncbi:MAG: two-component system response regulator, partial [Miltoncostaeaceae bacterium]
MAAKSPPREGAPRVLVVVGDPAVCETARETLAQEGYDVVTATNGYDGLRRYDETSPDLVLLEVDTPELDGLSTCRQLRRRPRSSTPVLFMTDTDDRHSVDEAYRAGATDFIAKPLNPALLGHRVRYLLRASRNVAELRSSQDSLARAQRIAQVGNWECTEDLSSMVWSDETYRVFGAGPGAVAPSMQNFMRYVHPDDRERVRAGIWDALHVSKSLSIEHRLLRPDGSVRHVLQQGELVFDGRSVTKLSATVQDVTEQRLAQQKIQRLANFDSLTGLSNRRLFRERLGRAIRAAQEKGHQTGLLYIDLDNFKRINDTLGHSAGDVLLKDISDRILENVRLSDVVGRVEEDEDPETAVSRLGGDEFTVLLAKIETEDDAGDVATRILEALQQPVSIEGHEVTSTGSIGIAIYPTDGDDVETLLKHADTALYHAKDLGRNTYQFFSQSMNQASVRRLTLETRLRAALENDGLELHYQPRLDLATSRMVSAEALLRWNDPELGKVPPKEFIPLAEDTGLIVQRCAWVFRTACARNRALQEAGYQPIRVSVNVSSCQFEQQDLCRMLSDVLDETHLEPSWVEIEITESLMLQDDEATALVLRDLKAMGIGIALDDFGTGYSSLSYLTRFPLDVLKMDRCFVRDIHQNHSAAGISAAVIQMAHSLGARVVAEGVDEQEQSRLLLEQGCDEVQGFLYSGALPAGEF